MLFYIILFTIIGFVIARLNQNNLKSSFKIMIIISIVWGISTALIWGCLSFGEMALGYFISNIFYNKVEK